jgi:hypothetical protein
MTRRAQDNLVAIVIAGIFIYGIVESLAFGPRARMVPLPLSILGLVLTLAQLIWQNLRSTDELQVDLLDVFNARTVDEVPSTPPAVSDKTSGNRALRHGEALAYGTVVLMLGLTLALGPVPAVFLLTGGYFVATRHYGWRRSLVYTIVFTLVVHLLFFSLLEVQHYHGLLEPLMERLR